MPIAGGKRLVTSGPNTPWSDDELERLMRLLAEGATRHQMAASLGRSPDSIKHGRFRLTSEGRWLPTEAIG